MRTVFKFEIPVFGINDIMIPNEAKILHFAAQRGGLFIWALVEPEHQLTMRRFLLTGTGQAIEEKRELRHIGSLQEGELVFHLFEVLPLELIPV